MQHWNALRDTALATSNQCRRTVSRFTPLIYAIDLRRSSRGLCHTVGHQQPMPPHGVALYAIDLRH
jgi:hypothetical protein